MKNLCNKERKADNPYEIWGRSENLPGWSWHVLKKWQADDNKEYARWLCLVKSPLVPEGEIGDVYVSDIKDKNMANAVLLCKGCSQPLDPVLSHNALSRYDHGYICSNCGTNEAFAGNFIGKPDYHKVWSALYRLST